MKHHSGYNVKSWGEYTFPEWVPIKIRDQIKGFWSVDCGRSPHDWAMSAEGAEAPEIGENVFTISCGRCVVGRYIHAWNNIGRVIKKDSSHVVCSPNSLIDYYKRITDYEFMLLFVLDKFDYKISIDERYSGEKYKEYYYIQFDGYKMRLKSGAVNNLEGNGYIEEQNGGFYFKINFSGKHILKLGSY